MSLEAGAPTLGAIVSTVAEIGEPPAIISPFSEPLLCAFVLDAPALRDGRVP
jgi:hypothetical protein